MPDRHLRGSRLGSVTADRPHPQPSATSDRAVPHPERRGVRHTLADDAEIPDTWGCRNGMEGRLIEGGEPVEPKKVKVPRTHWDMLRERRSIEQLEELLKERLEIINSRRRGS